MVDPSVEKQMQILRAEGRRSGRHVQPQVLRLELPLRWVPFLFPNAYVTIHALAGVSNQACE